MKPKSLFWEVLCGSVHGQAKQTEAIRHSGFLGYHKVMYIFTVTELIQYHPALCLATRLALELIVAPSGICLKSENENEKVNNVNPAECGGILEFPSGSRALSVT